MVVRPLGDRVLVKQVKAEAKSAGGIIIPEIAQEKTNQAVVVAVGNGTEKEPITVKVGEMVIYDKYSGTSVKIDGDEHIILKMSDVIAVVEG